MRHRKSVIKLGRTPEHRKALLANLAALLFEKKHIQTTEAKAKATRQMAERLITLAKKGTLHARRLALQRLRQKRIVKILFEEVAPRYMDRNGGYTRVVKLGRRLGDGAPMAVIELVGFETAEKKHKEREAKREEKEKQKKQEAKEEKKEKKKEEKGEKGKEEKGKKK